MRVHAEVNYLSDNYPFSRVEIIHRDGSFPHPGWTDFLGNIIQWWVAAIFDNRRRFKRLLFMDGSFEVALFDKHVAFYDNYTMAQRGLVPIHEFDLTDGEYVEFLQSVVDCYWSVMNYFPPDDVTSLEHSKLLRHRRRWLRKKIARFNASVVMTVGAIRDPTSVK